MIASWPRLWAALLLILCLAPAPAGALVKPGMTLPPLSLPDAQGQQHNLAELTRGKVALITYWSVSCPHCRHDLPRLQALARHLEGNPFVWVLINGDGKDMLTAAKAYAQEMKLPGPLLIDTGPQDDIPFAIAFDILATPGVLVLDKTGRLILAQELKVNLEQVQAAIESAF